MRSRPQMFRNDPATRKARSEKLSSLSNLGPVMEKAMNRAGIKTVTQFKKMGWQKAWKKLIQLHPRYRHTIYAEVLIGALQDKIWHQISERDKAAAKKFAEGLR